MPCQALSGALETAGKGLSSFSEQLTELELASGLVLGEEPESPPLPEVDPGLVPLEALSQAIIPHLKRPPCLVSFSGGRDSSAVLAVATAVARREGLELPIPITHRFPHALEANESRWQELVIRHVGSPDWIRNVVTDELDFVGPIAQESLHRHGVLYPTNAFFVLPLLRQARGGTLLTGLDGDSLLRTWRWVRAASVLAGRVRPTPRDVLRIGVALAPLSVRAWRAAQRDRLDLPWLRAEALELVRRRFYTDLAAEPFAWPERIRWFSRRRALAVTGDSLDRLARDSGAAIAHPLVDSRFLATLARAGGRFGFGDLTSIMRIHFGSLLPSDAIQRSDKATFGEVFWGPHSRKLMELWRGQPIPCEFVDARGLADAWQEPQPEVASAALLQALSLASERQREASRESRDLVG